MTSLLPGRVFYFNADEELTGQVQEQDASDIEERSARAIDKLPEWEYAFRLRINPITGNLSAEHTNLTGEVEIDFFGQRGNEYKAILVDGEISHFYALWQRAADEEKTEKINAFMKRIGQGEAIRIPFWQLADQDTADRTIRNLLM